MMLLKSVNYNMAGEYGGINSYDVIYEFRPMKDQLVNGMTMDSINKCICENLLGDVFGISVEELKEAFPEKFI